MAAIRGNKNVVECLIKYGANMHDVDVNME